MQRSRYALAGFVLLLACGTATVVNKAYVAVGGQVSGLIGTLVLQINDAETLTLTEDGAFSFGERLDRGVSYKVTVVTQPDKQECTIEHAEGTIDDRNPPSLSVACVEGDFLVGGTVSGLFGTLVLQNNSGDDLTVTSDGSFRFATPGNRGGNYSITVLNQPRYQVCVVSDSSGTITGDVSLAVSCTIQPMVATGGTQSCAVSSAGKLRCWGGYNSGETGYGLTSSIGDDELPSSVGDVDVGGTVLQVSTGTNHTCALLTTGAVRCWGKGLSGRLGYGNTDNIGDDEKPSVAGDVSLGGLAIQVSAGGEHSCALLASGGVRCWGNGAQGRLGYGNTNNIGDDELPSSVSEVNVGGKVTQIATGGSHTCAVLESGGLRCWGYGTAGTLGYGNGDWIGDDEEPASVGDINTGAAVKSVAVGDGSTCALLTSGAVHCWGLNHQGQLGRGVAGNLNTALSAVDVGGKVKLLAMGANHVCAVLESDAVRCWGQASGGRLGYGNSLNIGDDEVPSSAGDVSVGGTVVSLAGGAYQTLALLADGTIRGWGLGLYGRLGYGHTNAIGDDELPSSAGAASIW